MSIETAKSLGTTYVKSLRVSGTKCRYGRKVIRRFNACRKDHGGRDGRCPNEVYDYDCNEDRYNKSEFSFDSLTKCSKPGRKVNFRYQQNI